MNKPPIYLVFGLMLICPGFVKAGAKNDLQCMADPQDLETLNETIEEARIGVEFTYRLAFLQQDFKGRMDSSDECEASFATIFVAFINNVKEIINMKKSGNAEKSVLESSITEVEKMRDRFARQVENEKEMALGKLKTVNAELQQNFDILQRENLKLKETLTTEKLKITRFEIEKGEVESARDTFLSLKDREEHIENLVTEAYSGDLKKLKNVIYFVSKFKHYSLASKALTTLFQEMKRHKHTHEKEIILMHYELERIMAQSSFPKQSPLMKYHFYVLAYETRPIVQTLFRVLENDIYSQNYEKLPKFAPVLAQRELELFVVDLAKQLFLNGNHNINFQYLLKCGEHFSHEINCLYLEEITRQLGNEGGIESMRGLHLWSFLQHLLMENNGDRRSEPRFQKCMALQESLDSTKMKYLQLYASYIGNENNHNTLYSWHREHYAVMKNLLVKFVIPFLDSSHFTDLLKFLTLNKYIKNLTSSEVKCLALEAVETKIYLHEVSLKLQNFVNMKAAFDQQLEGKCSGVKQRGPYVFQYLLDPRSNKCKFINNGHRGEPLYCPEKHKNNDLKNRPIFSWIEGDDDPDQYWNLYISYKGYPIEFQNIEYDDRWLEHFSNSNQAWAVYTSTGNRYWRIEANDHTTRLLKIVSDDNRYVYASGDLHDSERRYVKLAQNPPAGTDLWTITC